MCSTTESRYMLFLPRQRIQLTVSGDILCDKRESNLMDGQRLNPPREQVADMLDAHRTESGTVHAQASAVSDASVGDSNRGCSSSSPPCESSQSKP